MCLAELQSREESQKIDNRSWKRGDSIGGGSFGTVSLALCQDTGKLFAVKSVSEDSSPNELRALENESQILNRIKSHRVVGYFGYGHSKEGENKFRNIFLEYMAGGSLYGIIQKFGGRLEESLVIKYARGILEGLNDVHSAGIIHCDVKCQNVLLGDSGVKLCDFGSSIVMHDEETKNSSKVSELRGTVRWMSPEAARQEKLDTSTDIWSFACAFIEMASGRTPWSQLTGNTFHLLLNIGCSDDLPVLPETLSQEAKAFLSLCLKRNPSERPTAYELLRHPFLSLDDSSDLHALSSNVRRPPLSPTSVLSNASDASYSTLCPSQTTIGVQTRMNGKSDTNSDPFDSDPNRFREFLTKFNSKTKPNDWASSSVGDQSKNWIVVHSSRTSDERGKNM